MILTKAALGLTLTLGILAAPLAADAQPPAKVARIGWIQGASPKVARTCCIEPFRQGLRELGYVEGQTIAIEYRWAEGRLDRLPDLAAELVRLKVDVIVAIGPPTVQALKKATSTIPIVMALVGDAVGAGFVASLARPGGNITGMSMTGPEIVGKQLQLLTEALPKVSRVAILWNPANPMGARQVKEAEVAARALGVRLQIVGFRAPEEFDGAFAAMTRERAEALLVIVDPVSAEHRDRLGDLALQHRLPAMFAGPEYAGARGLMGYGAHMPDLFRRAATYVDKILKGAKPGDLPVEQPMKFELMINMKTAKALGLTIPQSILIQADKVIK